MTRSFQRTRRTLENLNTCPVNLLEFYLGDCLSCRMPIAPKRAVERTPELSRWFMRAAGEHCSTCYNRGRQRDRPTTRKGRRFEHSGWVNRVTAQDIPRLRAMVGACVGCGWTSDAGRHDRYADWCPELPRKRA